MATWAWKIGLVEAAQIISVLRDVRNCEVAFHETQWHVSETSLVLLSAFSTWVRAKGGWGHDVSLTSIGPPEYPGNRLGAKRS